jgi:two-component system chemotaxis response regulator CheB
VTGARIRVLIADDSPTVRSALQALLSEDPRIEVVGTAIDGVEALAQTKALRPDVITMDVKMPRLDGLEATAAIMATSPARILIVAAVTEASQQDLSFRAIEAGALEVIAKPSGAGAADLRGWGRKVAEAVRLMAEVPVVTRRRVALSMAAAQPPGAAPHPAPASALDPIERVRRQRASGPGAIDAFAIVASTGGPPALARILGALPPELPVPIYVAQHMAVGFMSGLLRWLSSVTALKVLTAQHGQAARPGHVYLPPDSHDLLIDGEGLLQLAPSPGGHCPSGNRLLHSLARAYGDRCGATVLTGMGDDGADGLLAIRHAGGATFAQDEASCVVFGMPKVAHAIGAAQALLPVDQMAPMIRDLSQRRR